MRIVLAGALILLTACYADSMFAPTRVAPTIHSGEDRPLRLADLDPSEIESVTIVRGLAASTLYGTHACAAVVITTKHAHAVNR